MGDFYKPQRQKDWNYGGSRWKLSRSKIDLFVQCPKCFYIDNKKGTARPPGFPFNLNSAVDALLKKEFDTYRKNGSAHPIMREYGIDVLPFVHAELDTWRENFKGIRIDHAATGLTITGAVDDLWVNKAGELIVVDYKATSKSDRIEKLEEDWHAGYKRQMEIYQWLLRYKGFDVSKTGYFLYANATKDRPGFEKRLDFELTLIAYKGNTDWIPKTLENILVCLESDVMPAAAEKCDYCLYRHATASF